MGSRHHTRQKPEVTVGKAIELLRRDDSEPAYLNLRDVCWSRVAEILGPHHRSINPVVDQVVHDMVTITYAVFSPDDIIHEEAPRVIRKWTDEKGQAEAHRLSADNDTPYAPSLAIEKRFNVNRQDEALDALIDDCVKHADAPARSRVTPRSGNNDPHR